MTYLIGYELNQNMATMSASGLMYRFLSSIFPQFSHGILGLTTAHLLLDRVVMSFVNQSAQHADCHSTARGHP